MSEEEKLNYLIDRLYERGFISLEVLLKLKE